MSENNAVVATAPRASELPPSTARVQLPEEPVIKIRAKHSAAWLDLDELWFHRELLFFMILRDLKSRYKQTVLGVSWVVLQPLLLTAVFTIVLGKLVRVETGLPYPVFAFAGLVPWTFFSTAVASAGYSLVANSRMITKVYFPRLIIPAAAVGVRLADFLISAVMLFLLMFYYDTPRSWTILLLPFMAVLLLALALGIGCWTAALNVRYRDTGTALPVLLQVWMFASPILYPQGLLPLKYHSLYELNPMVGIVQGVRASLHGRDFNLRSLSLSVVVTAVILVSSLYFFKRMEDEFADIV